ncbi:GNAT family N-acetyltransferase [Nocardia sp. NPDC059240]|uniref:GNAT family N-acetyltransferase n=1 Tax=Nocardia sp. NPDC059240 TaxID=3346786 RepID=UPI00367A6171
MEVSVRPALIPDVPELARVLGTAFSDDPMITWMIPQDAERPRRAAALFGTLVRHHYLRHGGVEVAFDDAGAMVGAAAWAPPGTWHISKYASLPQLPGLIYALRGRLMLAGRATDRMATVHPREPHWYLAFVGTLPSARGLGYGQALMNSRLDRCDIDRIPAYLESSRPDNVPYYERFGFESADELDTAPSAPPLWPMWRPPGGLD